MALTEKGKAAWDAIKLSGQVRIKRVGAGGALLANGLRIHAHTISSLRNAGLLRSHTWQATGLWFKMYADDNATPPTLTNQTVLEGWHFEVVGLPAKLANSFKCTFCGDVYEYGDPKHSHN